eukprot:5263072-Prymnesium_polylepis.1
MDVAYGGQQRAVGLHRPTPVADNRRGRRGGSRRSTSACRTLASEAEATQRRRHEEWDDTQAGEAEEALGDEEGGEEPSDEHWPDEH